MRKTYVFAALLMFLFSVPVFAFDWNPISWVKAGIAAGGMSGLAWILTALCGLAVFGTVAAVKIVKTMKEAGELLIALSDALSDRKVTANEIKMIRGDIRDVFDIWKKTPEEYKTDGA